MATEYPTLDGYIADFINKQHMFFVATAAPDGYVNVSPKGGTDTLKVVGSQQVAYLDLSGSGAETVAHVKQINRITVMWCAFEGPPTIVRIHGTARIIPRGHAEWDQWYALFDDNVGARAIVVVDAQRISDSCGMGVPLMDYTADRTQLDRWAKGKGEAGLKDFWERRNTLSLDGFPAFEEHDSPTFAPPEPAIAQGEPIVAERVVAQGELVDEVH